MEPSLPAWLKPIVRLEDFNGEVDIYLGHIFSLFEQDFINSQVFFRGKKVIYDKTDDNGRPSAFVHITTEENRNTTEREICLRRCERISWIRAIIENCEEPQVLVWEKEQATSKRRAIRTYLFLEQEDFLVILQEIKHGHYMVTAIYVDSPHQKRKHLKEHKEFKEKGSR